MTVFMILIVRSEKRLKIVKYMTKLQFCNINNLFNQKICNLNKITMLVSLNQRLKFRLHKKIKTNLLNVDAEEDILALLL